MRRFTGSMAVDKGLVLCSYIKANIQVSQNRVFTPCLVVYAVSKDIYAAWSAFYGASTSISSRPETDPKPAPVPYGDWRGYQVVARRSW
jgi:hypothetical protein